MTSWDLSQPTLKDPKFSKKIVIALLLPCIKPRTFNFEFYSFVYVYNNIWQINFSSQKIGVENSQNCISNLILLPIPKVTTAIKMAIAAPKTIVKLNCRPWTNDVI